LKPERWGSPLVQEKYQAEKARDKRHPYRIIRRRRRRRKRRRRRRPYSASQQHSPTCTISFQMLILFCSQHTQIHTTQHQTNTMTVCKYHSQPLIVLNNTINSSKQRCKPANLHCR